MDQLPIININVIIIAITVLTSIPAFSDFSLRAKLVFSPYDIKRAANQNWHRFITSGFIHADFMHLGFNMYVLYLFGKITLTYYMLDHGTIGTAIYLLMYVTAIPVAMIYGYFQNKDNPGYRALGASGAVSAVLFSSILYEPWAGIGLLFIPIYIPGFAFGALYLIISHVAAKRANDNIGHDAHFYGAVYGFIFPIILNPGLLPRFIQTILNGST